MASAPVKLKRKDFQSDQEVRWCPGCGDYAILASVQKFLPSLGVPREKLVFISGIGCSSRFPYYMKTFGFHTIHGRAPTFATGVKVNNPDLSVWMVTGDGDALSIGGNHILHILRRNVDLNILLFNNQIYGLTKGQYSPTSEVGKKTKSTPMGSVDHPLKPITVALGADATFVARTIDTDAKHMETVLKAASEHRGTSFIEIIQNCPVFNDGTFSSFTAKDQKVSGQLRLEHGQPMVFADDKLGIRLGGGNRMTPEVVEIGANGVTIEDILVHDAQDPTGAMPFLLSRFTRPEMPMPIGVFRSVKRPTYDAMVNAQVNEAVESKGEGDIMELLNSGATWDVQ